MGMWQGGLGAGIQTHHAQKCVSVRCRKRSGLALWSLEKQSQERRVDTANVCLNGACYWGNPTISERFRKRGEGRGGGGGWGRGAAQILRLRLVMHATE